MTNKGIAGEVMGVRVCKKNVIEEREFGERKIGAPRPGVDENVVVQEHRRGAQMPASDPAAAPQDSQLHGTATAAISRRKRSRRPIRPAEGFCALPPLPSRTTRRERTRGSCAGG